MCLYPPHSYGVSSCLKVDFSPISSLFRASLSMLHTSGYCIAHMYVYVCLLAWTDHSNIHSQVDFSSAQDQNEGILPCARTALKRPGVKPTQIEAHIVTYFWFLQASSTKDHDWQDSLLTDVHAWWLRSLQVRTMHEQCSYTAEIRLMF